jgi:antitoxin MazE
MDQRTTTQLAKWGNSLALRIPKSVAEGAHLREGDRLTLDLTKEGNLIVRLARKRYSLEELVSRITRNNRHAETDWGSAVGKETW